MGVDQKSGIYSAEIHGVPTSYEMSLRIPQSTVAKNQGTMQPRSGNDCNDGEVQESLPTAIDSMATVLVPDLAYWPYTHSKKDVSGAPSPSSSIPPTIVEDSKTSIMTHSSGEVSANDTSQPDRLKWRLASGFFAYFMCGWGDGGKLSDSLSMLISYDSTCPTIF